MAQIPVGLQLYTVRGATAKDMAAALKRVAEIGYRWVEFAGYGSLDFAGAKRVVTELGLSVSSMHVGLDEMQRDLDQVISEAKGFGAGYVTIPYLGDAWRSADGYRRFAELCNSLGRRLQQAGLQLCYHNHSFEFERYEGRTGFEILWSETDPTLLMSELDVYWVKHGGEDPVAWMKRLAGRCPLVHLKDMADDAQRSFAEVGYGTIDFEAIFAASAEAGTRFYIVEQDTCPGDPFDSVSKSFARLQEWGKA